MKKSLTKSKIGQGDDDPASIEDTDINISEVEM